MFLLGDQRFLQNGNVLLVVCVLLLDRLHLGLQADNVIKHESRMVERVLRKWSEAIIF
jgi:hypothetical protein